jgi:hypothetical protein
VKSNIDTQHPLIKVALSHFKERMVMALDAPQNVERAVLPLYTLPKSKGHQKPKTKPEQIGSSVLLNLYIRIYAGNYD